MKQIIRYNTKDKEIINEYMVLNNEKVIQINNTIYIATREEFNKYINGEIEPFEFDEPAFELEENEIFIFK